MADDYTPTCWIVGSPIGGHAVWDQAAADAGRRNGWTVIPMYSADTLAKAKADEHASIIAKLREIRAAWGDDSRTGAARGIWIEILTSLGADPRHDPTDAGHLDALANDYAEPEKP